VLRLPFKDREEPVARITLLSVRRGQCDAKLTVAFPEAERHHCWAGAKLYCLLTVGTK